MKIVITGGKGMLGRTLTKKLTEHEIIVADKDVVDITNSLAFDAFLKAIMPDTVIHCAAMTDVDWCESDVDGAFLINAVGSANVASSCRRCGARLIAISTDYVFDGDSFRPYNEYDIPMPKTVYGKSKYAGEEAIRNHCPNHVIIRIAWLYGQGGPSFIHTMMKLASNSDNALKVVRDQIGNPTSADAVAFAIRNFLAIESLCGTFHVTCEGEASWYDLAKELFILKNISQNLIACTSEELPRPALRPHNSRLDKMNLRLCGLSSMPHWKDALRDFLKTEVF